MTGGCPGSSSNNGQRTTSNNNNTSSTKTYTHRQGSYLGQPTHNSNGYGTPKIKFAKKN